MAGATVALSGTSLTASRGTIYGQSGAKVAAVFPSVTAYGTMYANARATGSPYLPKVRAVGYGGASGAVTFPTVTFAGSMNIPNLARAEITLPAVTMEGSMLVGLSASAAIVLPLMRVLGHTGGKAALVLPSVLGTGAASVMESAHAALTFPRVLIEGTGFLWSEVASGHIVLPALHAGANAHASIVLPRLIIEGLASNDPALNVAQAWATNIDTGAVTQFTNFPFRAFVRFNNQYYGIGMSGGLYLLEGDTDAGTAIPWEFETGMDDLDNPAQKGILGVYVDGLIQKGAELTVITDTRARYVYPLSAPNTATEYRPHRVLVGRGIRSRSIGLAMRSLVGGYVEVNQLAPLYVVSKRSI